MVSKYLGQHFLINKSAVKKIIAALDLQKGETIIEIGPGKGALTIPLAQECQKIGCKITAIEKDQALAQRLEMRNEKLEIIVGDALKKIPELISHFSSLISYKVVGNIPYYITGKLLRILSELEKKPELIVLTVQREVAERITARGGQMNPVRGREVPQRASASNGMNLLAAAVQFWAEPEIIGYLKPADFQPPPEVQSAIVKLIPKPKTLNAERYYPLIKVIFKQPRKTLLNNLAEGLKISKNEVDRQLKSLNLGANARPQDLDIQTIAKISSLVDKFL